MRWIFGALFSLAFLVGKPVYAQFYDGNHLIKGVMAKDRLAAQTQKETDWQESAELTGYVAGAYDQLRTLSVICPKAGVTLGQIVAIVSKYLKANPEQWQTTGSVLVYRAVQPVFPCKQ